jgi:hypothetical protein
MQGKHVEQGRIQLQRLSFGERPRYHVCVTKAGRDLLARTEARRPRQEMSADPAGGQPGDGDAVTGDQCDDEVAGRVAARRRCRSRSVPLHLSARLCHGGCRTGGSDRGDESTHQTRMDDPSVGTRCCESQPVMAPPSR